MGYFRSLDDDSLIKQLRDERDELEAKVDELTAALGALVALKTHKDIRGKDEHYLRNQPAAWEQAKAALKQEVKGE